MALFRLYPVADFSVGANVGSTGGAPHYTKVDEPYNQVNDSDEVFSTAAAEDATGRILYTLSPLPPVYSINSVTVRYRSRRDTGSGHSAKGVLRIAGADHFETTYTPGLVYGDRAWTLTTNPGTTQPWVSDDLDPSNFKAGFEGWDAAAPLSSIYHSILHVEVDAIAAPVGIGQVRDRLTRELRLLHRPSQRLELAPPLRLAAYGPLTDLAVSHFGFPPAGAGILRSQRRLAGMLGWRLNLDDLRLEELRAYDLRGFRVADWDTCYSPDDEPAFAEGVARLSRGGRTFTRASKAWCDSPVDRRIVELPNDAEILAADGLLLQNARSNYVPYPAFVAGLLNWTPAGTGVNGSTIGLDASRPYFDLRVVPGGSVKFRAGDPHTTDLTFTALASATVTAGTNMVVSIAHVDQGGQLRWKLQRGSDGWYWSEAAGTWTNKVTWNALPLRSTWTRDRSLALNVGGTGTALTLAVGIPATGGVAGQVNWLGHAQVEDGRYPTSPIVGTSASPATRARDELVLSCDHGRRTWPPRQGSARLWVRSLWSDADLAPGDTRVLLDWTLDAANNAHVRLARSSGTGWIFQRRHNASNYASIHAGSVTAGQDLKIALRWTGPEGELGLPPYTLSTFVNGVRGADVAASGLHQVLPAYGSLRVGSLATPTTAGADCYFRWREILPFVLDDDELCDF